MVVFEHNYLCPMCDQSLDVAEGDGMSLTNGLTLYCPNRACPAQEVSGHGRTFEDAFRVIREKFPIDKIERN